MPFLRDTAGADVLLPSPPRQSTSQDRALPSSEPTKSYSQTLKEAEEGSPVKDIKGKGRAVEAPAVLAANETKPGLKRRREASEPADSLLKRLAGPSTGKAGLKRDPNEVQQIIYNSSKGGHFFKNEERKDVELTVQINAKLKDLEEAIARKGGDLRAEEKRAGRIIQEQESRRDLSQYIVVVDCDAFYASVEELDDPSLKGKAFAVEEGVLTTASYAARKYGCRSAMPGYIAKKLCPELIFVKPDFKKYSAASSKVMNVLARYDPEFAPASLDEAYMNLTAFVKRSGMTAEDAIRQMREEVKAETGLTVSAGCGPNTMIAKIAADVNKPNGQCVIEPTSEACRGFMQNLSVRKIPGIGRVTERWLEVLGVLTCQDIFRLRGKLMLAKGDSGATALFRAYLGLGNNVVERGKREDRRGVGHETTFHTIWRPKELDDKLHEIVDSLAGDLERLEYSGRTLTLKLKLETYEVLSRSFTPGNGIWVHTAEQLYKYGKTLLDQEVMMRAAAYDDGKPIKGKGRDLRLRLMGLKISNLRDDSKEAQEKRKENTNSLHAWTKKSSAAPTKTRTPEAIDLTDLIESEPEDASMQRQQVDCETVDEDFNDDLLVAAAPCPICHLTFSYANDSYDGHVKICVKATIDLCDSDHFSGSETVAKPLQPQRASKRRSSSFDCKKPKLHSTKRSGKQSDAFQKMMKQAKKRGH